MDPKLIARLWLRLGAICYEMAEAYNPTEKPVRKAPPRNLAAERRVREMPPELRARAEDSLVRAGYLIVPSADEQAP